MNEQEKRSNKKRIGKEEGQSIVLVALMMIGILAFVGIAVDVGLIFARRSQLSKAVDSAVLAAVTEVESLSLLSRADDKSAQFLNSNLPLRSSLATAPSPAPITFVSGAEINELGAYQYSLTATWPVDLYFLSVIGLDNFDVMVSAAAAYFPITDVYASRRVEDGALSTSNQAVFGPKICSANGDPFSPDLPNWTPLSESAKYNGLYSYEYRILIPADYPSDIVRVELFDPDSINKPNNNGSSYRADVSHTQVWIDSGRPAVENLTCSSIQQNPCLINTGEVAQLGLPLDMVNPWWFVRIDENRRPRSDCGAGGAYSAAVNTQTTYELFYYRENISDGTIIKTDLARYTGQTGDGVRDNGGHLTDMHWVSPGAQMIYDQPANVPTTGPGSTAGDYGSFEISISNDLVNILRDPDTGYRYIYLDVTAITGSSENGFEIWAGPPDYVNTISSNVNSRNVQVINNPGSHSSRGVTVFGLGNLPMNSNYTAPVDIPLIYVPAEYAGQEISVSLFDSDSGAQPPVVFFFDSVSEADWSLTFSATSNPTQDPDHDPVNYPTNGRCRIGACQNVWIDPPYKIMVPTYDPALCSASPTNKAVCTPFFGGRLVARYKGGQDDTYGWQIRLKGLPYLIR
ncbi:MAG: Tad domain-containing protein [Chloroflexi bacterium]|nr:Tad domain-containing protein [Chloroflexota bacterium]